ncbi:MAG: SPFH domain-containing protein [Acidimicrobiales bacterium]
MPYVVTAVILLPLLAVLFWLYRQEARVQIESGHAGLLIARGQARQEALRPGVHYVWPYRRQTIEIDSLRDVSSLASDDDQADGPPVNVDLADGAAARVSCVMRYRIDPDMLFDVHEHVGPDGVGRLARDFATQAVVELLEGGEVTSANVHGPARRELERRLSTVVTERLAGRGIAVTLFGLRDVDLGPSGMVIRDTSRVQLELQREEARAAIRQARVDHEIAQARKLTGALDDTAVRYLQIEAWREYVDRWDGKGQLPLAWPGIGDPVARRVEPTPAAAEDPAEVDEAAS